MARYKISKSKLSLDMTAMCDVGFLILSFFILTGRPKSLNTDLVKLPFASFEVREYDGEYASVIISDGRCFMEFGGDEFKKELIAEMAKKYSLHFSVGEINKLIQMPSFGTPMSGLQSFIHKYNNTDDILKGQGIPVDGTRNNELMQWVTKARDLNKQLYQRDLKFILICGKSEPYPFVKMVMDDLRREGINKFELVHQTYSVKNYQ